MRRYDIVSGILLILSIVDFALAAPVLVQEKRQACVDVVPIPKDGVPVLGKRGNEELEKLAADYFKTWGEPVESSDAHASSISAPPGPDHGSTNVVQAPGPNQASSTANPGLLMEPSSPSSVQGALGDPLPEDQWSNKGDDGSDASEPLFTPGSSENGADHESTGVHPDPIPPTNPDPDFDWNYWMSLDDPIPPRPASPKEIGLAPEYQVGHVQQPDPGSPTDPDFDWNLWGKDLGDPLAPSPKPASQKELGLAPEDQEHVQQPNTGPLTDPDFDWDHWMNLDIPLAPSPRPASQKELDLATEHEEHVQQPNLASSKSGLSKPGYSYPGYPNPGYPNPNLADEYFWGKPVESSDAHALSSPAPPGPDHGSPNVVQSPAPNSASSTANPGPIVEPSSPSSTAPMQGSWDRFNALWDDQWWYKPGAHVPQPNADPGPLTELDSDRNLMSAHQPEQEVATPPSPDLGSPKEPEYDVVNEPPPSPGLTDPELHLDHQSLSTDSPPVDLLAAIYAAKGKAKEARRISGTARDGGNAI
jgi:hypothetical protein